MQSTCKNVEFLTLCVFVGRAGDSFLTSSIIIMMSLMSYIIIIILCTFNDALGSLRDPDPLGGIERELPRPNPLHDLLRTQALSVEGGVATQHRILQVEKQYWKFGARWPTILPMD